MTLLAAVLLAGAACDDGSHPKYTDYGSGDESGSGGGSTSTGGTGGSKSSASGIDGTWISSTSPVCALGFTFDSKTSTYTDQALCQLQGGANSYGVTMTVGTFDSSTAGRINLTPTKSSCPAKAPSAGYVTYSVSGGNQLTLGFSTGFTIYSRVPTSNGMTPANAQVQYGCWDMGVFTPHTLDAL